MTQSVDVTAPALAHDFARCAQITRAASSNFYYAFMLLEPHRRQALYATYAFCRFLDDIADDHPAADAGARLATWRRELELVYLGRATRPVARALAASVRRFPIPRRYFEEIIEGVEMDLSRRRYDTFAELREYCYRVASAVGLACIEIFGYRNPRTQIYAENLGLAFQLTNIIRDVREDAQRGRIYLPLEDLARFAVSEEEVLAGHYTDRFVRLLEFQAARAGQFYTLAAQALPQEDRGSLLSAEAMRLIYRALLRRIVKTGYRVMDGKLSLSAPYRLLLVGQAWAQGRLLRGRI
ncbi:MAG TPA: presqualene diphosphate synthase HpnD [Candidatus Binataceae bacterium]|nr:presqualene diphosphate synthase HpnD [Candidatus Binataceae bacterium]